MKEFNQDLDILVLSDTTERYSLKKDHLLQLIHLLRGRTPFNYLYELAKHLPDDPICKEIVESGDKRSKVLAVERMKPYSPEPAMIPRKSIIGQKFETDIKHKDNVSWVKCICAQMNYWILSPTIFESCIQLTRLISLRRITGTMI